MLISGLHCSAYDDYALLAAKLAPTASKLDVSGAGRWDEDWEAIKAKCPNIEIITEQASAVQNVRTAHAATGVFTLSGQRVATTTKGIYIVDGKKMVVR